MPRAKHPTEAQRYYMAGHHPNSIMGRLSNEERKRIKALMTKDRDDRAVFERSMKYGSQPRRG